MSRPLLMIAVLSALTALAPFAIDTYLPAFPVLEQTLGGTTLQIQQSLTVYLLPYALMTLWHGAASDAIGRLNAIRLGLWVFALASIGCALAPNVETFLLFRALQGMSGGAGNVVARAMVRDLFAGAEAQRVMAQVQIIFGIAPAIAPIIGGLLLNIHWQVIFIFLCLYALAALFAAHRILPETMPPERRIPFSASRVLAAYRQVFSDRQFFWLTVASGANFAGFFLYVLASPVFLVRHLGLGSHQFGWMFVPTVVGMMLGSYLARWSAGRYANMRVLRAAYLWMGAMVLANVTVSLWFSHAVWWMHIAPIACYNIGMALALPILSIEALDRHPKLRGTAASGQAFVQMLLSAIAAGAVVPLLWSDLSSLALGMSGALLLGWLMVRQTTAWKGA